MDRDCDVIVVGLGPVGAVLTGLLARWGVSVTVVERDHDVYRQPRAAHFDHEVMRIFQELGVADAAARHSRPVTAYEFVNRDGEMLMRFASGPVLTPSGWPGSFLFFQPGVEIAIRESLATAPGVTLRTGQRVTQIVRNDAEGVKAAIIDDGGREQRISARFLIGADGGASAIRKLCGIGLHDYGFEENFLVIDAWLDDETGMPAAARQFCNPSRPAMMAPMGPGRWRWEFMRMPGETTEQLLDDDHIQRLMAPYLPGPTARIERKAVYQFHGLVANNWRSQSVILAGDAAHQMPPFMGQGMCSGIRDAANLAWKLAFVLRGHAPQAMLDSYQAERDPHVRGIIERAIELGRVVCIFDEAAAHARDLRLKAMMAEPDTGARRTLTALPGLTGGLITATRSAGRLFPQPFARRVADGHEGRLDDLLPRAFWLVTRGDGRDIGPLPGYVHPVRLDIDIEDEGTLGGWLGEAEAALVRPDRYVFGTGVARGLVSQLTSGLAGG